MFVEGQNPWLDEQTVRYLSAFCILNIGLYKYTPSQFQELFAICQALPGPASTKLGFCIVLLQGGFLAAVMFFLTWRWAAFLRDRSIYLFFGFTWHVLFVASRYWMGDVVFYHGTGTSHLNQQWSLPGAAGMYALAIGISHVSNTLPLPVYALLSGLNAATVGVIAFAAVQLATKAITDPLSRLIVVFSACAGMCYNALWYFPVLMVGGGISTVVWDLWARNFVVKLKKRWRRRKPQTEILEMTDATLPLDGRVQTNGGGDQVSRRSILSLKSTTGSVQLHGASAVADPRTDEDNLPDERASERSRPEVVSNVHVVPAKIGVAVVIVFLGMFWSTHSRLL
jgi:chromate transport protein ChrA